MKITLNNVRLAFLHIWTPKTVGDDGKQYYKAALPIEPGSENAKRIEKAMIEAAKNKWGDKWETALKKLKGDRKVAYEEKSPTNDDGEVYDGFEGMYVLNTGRPANKGRPTIIDRDKTPLVESDGKPYAGCYANVIVELWPQDNKHGRRINCDLLGIQFVKDGESFGGGSTASADDFEALPDMDEDDDDFV